MGCFRLARVPPRDLVGGGPVRAGQTDPKLVAAEPGDGVRLPHRPLQAGTDLLQDHIAVVVAEGVVDLLEAIQVQQQQRERCVLVAAGGDGLLHVPLQEGAIGQPGQQIMRGLVGQLVLGSLALGDIADDAGEDAAPIQMVFADGQVHGKG